MTARATTNPRSRQTATVGRDWKGADFDSFEVLVLCHEPDPISRVARARQGRRQERTTH